MWWETIPCCLHPFYLSHALSAHLPCLTPYYTLIPKPHQCFYRAILVQILALVFAWSAAEEICKRQTHHLPQEHICCSSITTILCQCTWSCLSLKGKQAFNYLELKPPYQQLLQRGGLIGCRTGQGGTWQGPYKHRFRAFIGVFMLEAGSNCIPKSWSFVSLMET